MMDPGLSLPLLSFLPLHCRTAGREERALGTSLPPLLLLAGGRSAPPPRLTRSPSDLCCLPLQGKSSGKPGGSMASGLDEEGLPRKTAAATKARLEAIRKEKEKHR